MKKAKLFIIYFPVILVSCQVIVNLLYFIWFDAYINAAFYNHLTNASVRTLQ